MPSTESITTIIEGNFRKKWSSFVDGKNGFLYGVPTQRTSSRVGKFSIETKQILEIGPELSNDGWAPGVRGNNGKIYCPPGTGEKILVIDTNNEYESVKLLDKEILDDYLSCAVAGDGNIYFMPYGASKILRLDIKDESLSLVGNELVDEKSHYGSTVASKSGRELYGLPTSGNYIIKYDLSNPDTTVLIGNDDLDDISCFNGVLGPDESTIYSVALDGRILKIDTQNDSYEIIGDKIFENGWWGAVVGADQNIYACPFQANNVLKFSPFNQEISLIGDDLSKHGGYKWRDGILASDGSGFAYFPPVEADGILQLDTRPPVAVNNENKNAPKLQTSWEQVTFKSILDVLQNTEIERMERKENNEDATILEFECPFRESIIERLQGSFTSENMNILPVDKHRKHKFFNRSHICRLAKENTTNTTHVEVHEIYGNNLEEFTEEFGQRLGVTISSVLPLAGEEFLSLYKKHQSQKEVQLDYFLQRRILVGLKFVLLHHSAMTLNDLEHTLNHEVYEKIKNIKSKNAATHFLRMHGLFYVSEAYIGGLRISDNEGMHISYVGESERQSKSCAFPNFICTNLGTVGNHKKARFTQRVSKRHRIFGRTVGGEPTLFRESSDMKDWAASLSDENCDISHCKFEPLYTIISSSTDDFHLCDLRKYLKYAHDKYIQDKKDAFTLMQCGGKYIIENDAYSNYCISASISGPQKSLEPEHIIEIDNLNCQENLIDEKVRTCTWTLSKSCDDDDLVSLENNGDYFGRNKSLWFSWYASIHSKGDGLAHCNQWRLREVHGSFYMLTFDYKYKLGIQKTNVHNNGDNFRYIISKYLDDETEIHESYMWKFRRIQVLNDDGAIKLNL